MVRFRWCSLSHIRWRIWGDTPGSQRATGVHFSTTLLFVIPTGASPGCGVSRRQGPEGRPPNVSPARKGWVSNDDDAERRRCGTIRVILRDISHSYPNNCVNAAASKKEEIGS